MEEIKILEIPIEGNTDICQRYCIENRNEIYFIAYETKPEKPISVLWSDLKFIRKYFGVTKFDENSPITHESLNESRKHHLANIDRAFKLNVHIRDFDVFNDDDTIKTHRELNTGKYYHISNDLYVEVPYNPQPMTKGLKKHYTDDKANGLYVICKFV